MGGAAIIVPAVILLGGLLFASMAGGVSRRHPADRIINPRRRRQALPPAESSRPTQAPPPPPAPPAPEVLEAMNTATEALAEGTATAAELDRAASAADQLGDTKLAERFRDESAAVRAVSKVKTASVASSPIKGVPDEAWHGFVRWAKQGKADTITPAYNLGFFVTSMRTLEDQGLATNVTKQTVDGKQVWKGEWTPPLTLEKFLGDAETQLAVLRRQMAGHAQQIAKLHKDWIGKEIEGKPATLSGLLGVSKHAGLGGLAKWLQSPDKRKPATTAAYLETTGMF